MQAWEGSRRVLELLENKEKMAVGQGFEPREGY